MNREFLWKSMGFIINHASNRPVDMTEFSPDQTMGTLEVLFNLGYIFYHPVHHITLESMDDYNTYILGKVK